MKRLLLLSLLVGLPAYAQVSGTIPSTGGGTGCVSIGVGGRTFAVGVQVTGTWTGTLQSEASIQGQAPVNLQSTITGNGTYTITTSGYNLFLLCGNTVATGTANVFLTLAVGSNVSGASGTASSVTNAPAPSSSYTIYPANSNCTTYSATGTTYCALNNSSGLIDASGTDIRAVWDTVTTNSPNGGTVYFKNGTYQCNSLDTESTGGYSNSYCLGIPGNVATNQYATWNITGEAMSADAGSSPVQTSGTIIHLSSTAINSVAAHTKIMLFWARPPTGTGAIGPSVTESNLTLRVPTNQRGCETASDLSLALNSDYENITTDTDIANGSLAFPVEDTCTSWGVTDRGGLVGVTTTNSSEQVQFLKNVNAWACDECIDVRGEHSVLLNSYGNTGNYCIEYGVHGGAMYHASAWLSSGWGECARGLTIGNNVQQGSSLDVFGMDVEDAVVGNAFAPVYHAAEATPGNLYGRITWTVVLGGSGVVHQAGIFDGGGGQNVQVIGYGSSIVPPAQLAVDSFHRANAVSLGTFWLTANTGANQLQIASNVAELLTTGAASGRARYLGEVFGNDQFTQATFASMDSNSATFAQVETNDSAGISTGSTTNYNYFCSRASGANQYGIGKYIAGTFTALSTSSTAVCPAPPFTLELRHMGSLVCAYLNGVPDTNIAQNCVVDSSNSGGAPSIYLAQDATAGVTVSNFLAGNLPPLHGASDSVYGQNGAFSALQQFSTIGTTTNCKAVGTAANPSVAACGASAAGTVSCATNASTGTCTVSTTAVTANSQVLVHQRADTTTGTRLGVTCNTTKDTNSTDPQITAVTAGTSFTFQLGTISTNPECFSYSIIN